MYYIFFIGVLRNSNFIFNYICLIKIFLAPFKSLSIIELHLVHLKILLAPILLSISPHLPQVLVVNASFTILNFTLYSSHLFFKIDENLK